MLNVGNPLLYVPFVKRLSIPFTLNLESPQALGLGGWCPFVGRGIRPYWGTPFSGAVDGAMRNTADGPAYYSDGTPRDVDSDYGIRNFNINEGTFTVLVNLRNKPATGSNPLIGIYRGTGEYILFEQNGFVAGDAMTAKFRETTSFTNNTAIEPNAYSENSLYLYAATYKWDGTGYDIGLHKIGRNVYEYGEDVGNTNSQFSAGDRYWRMCDTA